ncbi:FapA family protein [Paenibacillus roseipurpureus]|uniref:FapA family protein n=1 Tax=Paenibacillus roseopurpureus TaxID=2918901 RepID=A0AA96RMG2_9BACL|nr:FapA family protein [Paenibacillus sp. MBLB1832]WNR46670.1 FapA family protein [Paenibacillus sp. MBLB1832]
MIEGNMPLDFYISISVSDDKLSAYMQISNIYDEFKVTAGQLADLVQKNHIQHGLNHVLIAEIAANPKSFYLKKTLIASGTKPVEGQNGFIKLTFDFDDNDKKPLELEDGKVNYKEVVSLHNVRKGQLIGQRFLATAGTPGRAVTGETLFTKAGKDVRFKLGKNVVTDAEQNGLYATIDGMVVRTDRDKINVFPVYEINGNVDYNVGNIDFIGTVVIRGNVLPGFKIRAAGDIRVTGGVEAAELEAEGSIDISAGIVGQNKAFIKAGKNIKSSFIQDATIEVAGDLTVTQSIMHSTVRAGRGVHCVGSKGLIVGGTIQAGELVSARTVGNSMSTTTIIEVGVLPELRNEMLHLRNQLRVTMENSEKTDKALSILDQLAAVGQLSPDKLAMRIKLNNTKKQAIDEQSAIKERILEIEKSLEDSENAKVQIVSTIYGGTKIVIGRYTKFIKDPTSRVTFRLHEGDITFSTNV